jgi:hypothetical protein
MTAKKEDPRVKAGGSYWGPGIGEGAGEATPASERAVDSKYYALVTRNYDGLRIEEEVLVSELGKGQYKDLSLDSKNVRLAHPAANQPTSGLTEEEIEKEGRKLG